jgi:hypothetical protein
MSFSWAAIDDSKALSRNYEASPHVDPDHRAGDEGDNQSCANQGHPYGQTVRPAVGHFVDVVPAVVAKECVVMHFFPAFGARSGHASKLIEVSL